MVDLLHDHVRTRHTCQILARGREALSIPDPHLARSAIPADLLYPAPPQVTRHPDIVGSS